MDKTSDAPMQMAPGHASEVAEMRLPTRAERPAERPAVDEYLDEPETTRWERVDGQRVWASAKLEHAVMRPAPPNYGSFSSEKKALEAILSRLAEALQPFRIYLFGSRAEGRAKPDSDFDLLVVLDDQASNRDADYEDVAAPLRGLGIGCDVIPCRRSEFLEVLADPTNPWQRVWASARRVYERPA